MKFSEETIRDFMARGDFSSIIRVFRSLQREIDTKDALFQEYMRDMSNLRTAFKKLEEQKDGFKRLSAAYKNLCTENALEQQVAELEQGLESPSAEALEELALVEDTGEPEELQPE